MFNFGDAKELCNNVLPTFEDVMQYYLFVKHILKPEITSKEPSVSSIAEIIAVDVEKVWLNHQFQYYLIHVCCK